MAVPDYTEHAKIGSDLEALQSHALNCSAVTPAGVRQCRGIRDAMLMPGGRDADARCRPASSGDGAVLGVERSGSLALAARVMAAPPADGTLPARRRMRQLLEAEASWRPQPGSGQAA
jgi:hypothetical protein